jgi:hypothetical protein
MNNQQLIDIAPDLSTISGNHIAELAEKMEILVAEMNHNMCKRSDIKSLVGNDNISMMKENHANHLRFVHSLLEQYNKQILVDTVAWVYRSYRSRGFQVNYWAVQINTWIDLFKKHLSEDAFESIYPLYEWFRMTVPHFSQISDEEMNEAQPVLCIHKIAENND